MRKNILKKCWDVYQQQGLRALAKKICHKLKKHGGDSTTAPSVAETYERLQKEKAGLYAAWRKAHMATDQILEQQRQHHFPKEPLISIVIPVYNTNTAYLKELMESILAQTYGNWELVMVDGCSTLESTKECLKAYAEQDERIHVTRLTENKGISGNTNEAILLSKGEYIAFSDHDDVWEPDALYEVAKAINEKEAELIYTDEDKVNEDSTLWYEPHLKPIYSPEKLQSCNYFCHLMVVSRGILDQAGFLDSRFDGSQDHELALRVCEHTEHIVHIPKVLYHWRQFNTSMSKQHLEKCQARGRLAVEEHLQRIGQKGHITQDHGYRIHYEIKERSLVSIIVVVHKKLQDTVQRILKLRADSSYENLEFVVVNLSVETSSTQSEVLHIIDMSPEIGDYAARNKAAIMAKGEYLLFLDEELVPEQTDWLEELIMYAQQPKIGAVGGKLFYEDADHIYATNYMLTPNGPVLEFNGHSRTVIGNGGRERIVRNVSAVPIEMLMVKQSDFTALDGFREDYRNSLGDVDFCLRLLANGKRNVFTPFASMKYLTTPQSASTVPLDTEDGKLFAKSGPTYFKDSYSIIPYENEYKEGTRA